MKFIFKSSLVLLLLMMGLTSVQAQTLVTGKASLERLDKGVYQISKSDGTVQKIDLNTTTQAQVPGTLALLFKDCESVRLEVMTNNRFSERDLKRTVEAYNNCNYSSYAPTESELQKAANFQGDQFNFYGGIGTSIQRISFFNLDDYESLAQVQLQLGIAGTPGFLNNLQGNLYFTLEASAGFSGEKDFDNGILPTSFKKNTYRLQLGSEFRFLKESRIQPMLGIGIGANREYYKGMYNGDAIDISTGDVFYSPRIGLFFTCNNGKAIGLVASYISEYENDLSFPKEEDVIPLIVDNHQFNLSLNYYF